MRFYIATSYENWKAASNLKGFLESRGHVVTSRWIAMAESRNGVREDQGSDISEEEKGSRASRDFEDIEKAHVLVLLTAGRSSAGAMCELGFALGRGSKLCIVIGEMDHLFHRYTRITHFPTEGEFIDWTNSFNTEEIICE